MIIPSVTYEEIIILLRQTLIENSRVKAERILDALSVRGTDMSDILNSTETYSYALSDVFILFELLKKEDGDNYITPKDDNTMLAISSYNYHLMIYGNGSDLCSQYIRTTFKQPGIAQKLRNMGIFITNVSSGESINEFINNTLLLRNDLIISIEVKYEIPNVTEQEYFSNDTIKDSDIDLIVRKV